MQDKQGRNEQGNGMSSQSHWTGDENISRGAAPADLPATDAGSRLGGDAARYSDQAEQGIPDSVIDVDSHTQETGTTFGTDPSGDKRL